MKMKDYKDVLKDFENIAGSIQPYAEILRSYRRELWELADDVVKEFYDKLFSYEGTAKIFKEDERPERERTFKQWFMKVVSGEYDDEFWASQYYVVALKHVVRGISNEVMLASMNFLQRIFARKLTERFSYEEAERIYHAFKHITDAIAAIMVSGYMNMYIKAISESTGMSLALIDRHVKTSANELHLKYMLKDN